MSLRLPVSLSRIVGLTVLLACATPPAVAQTTIFYDDFSRGTTGAPLDLNGSSPTITTGGAKWTTSTASGTTWTTNGTNLNVAYFSYSASLPLTTLSNGLTYQLSADVTVVNEGSGDNFMGIGFAYNLPTGMAYYYAAPWMSLRAGDSKVVAYPGVGVATAPVFNAVPSGVSYSAKLRIDYTPSADGTSATASYYVNDIQVGTAYTYSSLPSINGVFIQRGSLSSTATVDNFTLTAAIPEPSTYATLAGVAALGFAAWRRRRASIGARPRTES
ncbi:MAG: PEP-CTERM sorting domain-containing protein [Opitutaceae bacterium]|nr:PEP-CTERM sorting domain-containing protein [Opitutaceae bacterium]